MNTLLMNREGFAVPADGWYQLAPLGEFAHAQAGLTQVIDAEACAAMCRRFEEEAQCAHFAGVLIDFDHDSLDAGKRSEAAGWIVALRTRDEGSGVGVQGSGVDGSRQDAKDAKGDGLWAKIRWSDVGEAAVKGGRYRYLSPVWNRGDCEELGDGRVRPRRLLNAAVTNDPNLKGMRPLSNSAAGAALEVGGQKAEVGVGKAAERVCHRGTEGTEVGAAPEAGGRMAEAGTTGQALTANRKLPNGRGSGQAAAGEQRYRWVMGDADEHCPSCLALAGQVHTMAEWDAAEMAPGSGRLYCQGHCKCRLAPTTAASSGPVQAGPLRRPPRAGGPVANQGRAGREEEAMKLAAGAVAERALAGGVLNRIERAVLDAGRRIVMDEIGGRKETGDVVANQWSDEARAASLAVRQAKAAMRQPLPKPIDTGIYLGGSKYFDERTGRYKKWSDLMEAEPKPRRPSEGGGSKVEEKSRAVRCPKCGGMVKC